MQPAGQQSARVVQLGHLAGLRADGRGRLYVWPEAGVIAPQTRIDGQAWRCELVATNRSWLRMGGDRPEFTDAELAALATTMRADPDDPEPYAMLWQTRVRQRWCAAHTAAVARVIAEGLRIPGTLTVELDLSAISHMIRQTHCTPQGLQRILARLARDGYLTHQPSITDGRSADDSAWVALILPPGGGLSSRTR